MREVKFRGFSLGLGGWRYGFGWCEIDYTDDFLESEGINPQAMLYSVDSSPVECELVSMGQLTGLKDTNDKQIYERDICTFDNVVNSNEGRRYLTETGEVVYVDGAFCIKFKHGIGLLSHVMSHTENLRIIGNVYENPELLEVAK